MYFGGLQMNTNIENLNQLPLNKIGKIKKIDCEECIKRRLLDMGLVKAHRKTQEHFLLEVLLLQ